MAPPSPTYVSTGTYQEAFGSNQPVWQLDIGGWGYREAVPSDSTPLVYPSDGSVLPGGAQCIAIGPNSTVDQIIVNQGDASLFSSDENAFSNLISIRRPGVQIAGPMYFTSAMSNMYGDTYIPNGTATTATAAFATSPYFERPVLTLLAYFQAPPLGLPLKRSDMYRHTTPRHFTTPADAGTEKLLAIWPVMGRRTMTVYTQALNASAGFSATTRVGRISCPATTVGIAGVTWPVETTVGTGSISRTVQDSIVNTQPCQFLAVYVTCAGGLGDNADVFVNLIATDD